MGAEEKLAVDAGDFTGRYLQCVLAAGQYASQFVESSLGAVFASLELAGSSCIVVGSSLGRHVSQLSRLAGPAGVVHAADANAELNTSARAFFQLQRIENVVFHDVLLGSQAGIADFFAPPIHSDYVSQATTSASRATADARAVRREMQTADDYFGQAVENQDVGLLLVDTFGGELDTLHGASAIVEKKRPSLVFKIYNEPSPEGYMLRGLDAFIARLEMGNYRLFTQWGAEFSALRQLPSYVAAYGVAVPTEKAAEFSSRCRANVGRMLSEIDEPRSVGDDDRFPKVFLHIPKTAGTSLLRALEKSLDGRVFYYYPPYNISFDTLFQDQPWPYHLISGHFSLGSLIGGSGRERFAHLPQLGRRMRLANAFTVLREPRARLLSQLSFDYHYFSHYAPASDLWRALDSRDLNAFVKLRTLDFDNTLVRYLCPEKIPADQRVEPRHLELSKTTIDQMGGVFFADNISRDGHEIAAFLGLESIDVDHLNRARAQKDPWIPADGEIAPFLQFDTALYAYANARRRSPAAPVVSTGTQKARLEAPAERPAEARRTAAEVEIKWGNETYSLMTDSSRDTIQAEIARSGAFYELAELEFLRGLLPASGSRILDVGANIGNHTIFFDKVCRAAYVGVVEADPAIAAELKQNVARNQCSSVDLRFAGIAAGAKDGVASTILRPEDRATNNRGGTRVVDDPRGATPVRRLDTMFKAPFDLIKIDVEGMALDVLDGARDLIESEHKPILFVEVETGQVAALDRWCEARGYHRRATFEMYAGLINYVLVPTPSASASRSSRETAMPEATTASKQPLPSAKPHKSVSALVPLKVSGSHYSHNLERACTLLESIRAFDVDRVFTEIVVLMPDDEVAMGAELLRYDSRLRIIPDSHLLPNLDAYPARPWKKQQILKLAFHEACTTDYYLTLDPDNFATRPFDHASFFRNEVGIMDFETKVHHPEWWSGSAALLGMDAGLIPDHVMTVTPCLYNCDIARGIKRRLEVLWQSDWTDVLLRQHHTQEWVEHGLYFCFLVLRGLYDKYHVNYRAAGLSALHSNHNIWFAADLDRWDVERCFADEGRGIFSVVQSNTHIDPRLVREKIAPFLKR